MSGITNQELYKFYLISVTLLAVHLVHANFISQYSGYVYFVTIANAVAHHGRPQFPWLFPDFFPNFPDFSLTNVKFPKVYRFSRQVVTLNILG